MVDGLLNSQEEKPRTDSSEVGSKAPLRQNIAQAIKLFVCVFSLGTCVICVTGLLGRLDPVFELATHCYFHCLIASFVLLPLACILKARTTAIALGLVLICTGWFVQPWQLWTASPELNPKLTDKLRILSWNVLVANQSNLEAIEIVSDQDPDVVVLIELRHNFLEPTPWLKEQYPYFFESPSWGGEGIGVYSRVEGTIFRIEDFENAFQPAIVAKIPGSQGQSVELVALHALSPLPRFRAHIRDRQLRAVANWAEQHQRPVCVCGDFNITPWSGAFCDMIESGFKDSRMGSGNCESWPQSLGAFGIPIDHAIWKGDCQILHRRVLPEGPGSDHRPIVFDLQY